MARDLKVERLIGAAKRFVRSYQAHVMEQRCFDCQQAWQRLREVLDDIEQETSKEPVDKTQ